MARDREESFKSLIVGRMKTLKHHLKLVGNLADSSNYKYTDKQVTEIFNEIDDAVDDCRDKFFQNGH